MPRADWWSQLVFISGQNRMTRSDLILAAANKDGGAHVDAALTPEYEQLYTGFIRITIGGEPIPHPNIHLIGLRQLGYEVLHSPDIQHLLL
jgi:hypothetical protein